MSNWALNGLSEGTSVIACHRDRRPENLTELWQGEVEISFQGRGLPLFMTLLFATIGAAADTELEYYT